MKEDELRGVQQVFSDLDLRNKLVEPDGQRFFEEISRDTNLGNHSKEELESQRSNHKVFSLTMAIQQKGKLPGDSQFITSVLRDLNYYDTSSRAKEGFNLRRLAENFTNTKEEASELKRPALFGGVRNEQQREW